MTGSLFQPSPGSTQRKRPPDTHTIGRWHQVATFAFLIGGIVVFGLAWLLGYVHFD